VVGFAYSGDPAEGKALTDELRAVADPYLDMSDTMPAPALAQIAGDPADPIAGRGAGTLLRDLDARAIDTYVELVGPEVDVPLIHLEIRHLGGALGRSAEGGGALDHVDAGFLLYGVGPAPTPEMDEAVKGTLAGILERMKPWAASQSLLAFAEQQPELTPSFDPGTAQRLADIKAAADPDGLILANHAG
jgi:hypothetical protein